MVPDRLLLTLTLYIWKCWDASSIKNTKKHTLEALWTFTEVSASVLFLASFVPPYLEALLSSSRWQVEWKSPRQTRTRAQRCFHSQTIGQQAAEAVSRFTFSLCWLIYNKHIKLHTENPKKRSSLWILHANTKVVWASLWKSIQYQKRTRAYNYTVYDQGGDLHLYRVKTLGMPALALGQRLSVPLQMYLFNFQNSWQSILSLLLYLQFLL